MQYPAQIQTAIEVTDEIGCRDTPADRVMAGFFKSRRHVGSSDKAVIADVVYEVQRWRGLYAWMLDEKGMEETPRALVLAHLTRTGVDLDGLKAIFTSQYHAPEALNDVERKLVLRLKDVDPTRAPAWARYSCQDWLVEEFSRTFGDAYGAQLAGLNTRAPTDIRVNTLKTTRETLKDALTVVGLNPQVTPYSPLGLRFEGRKPLYTQDLFKAGHFEIQDEAAQLVAMLMSDKLGAWVVDFCAGGGGKTLALAALMKNKGRLEALDIHERRLEEIRPRLIRAGVHNCRATLLKSEHDGWIKRHTGQIDTVLVDAPCSGSGTWRRNPDAKWRLTPARLQELTEIQASILTSAAHLVKPDGRMVYATCSLLKRENDDQINTFLAHHPDFSLLPVEEAWPESPFQGEALHVTPAQHGCDGFYAAVLQRRKLAV